MAEVTLFIRDGNVEGTLTANIVIREDEDKYVAMLDRIIRKARGEYGEKHG